MSILGRLKAEMRQDQTGRLGLDPGVTFSIALDEVPALAEEMRADGRFDRDESLPWIEAMIRAGRVCVGVSPVLAA